MPIDNSNVKVYTRFFCKTKIPNTKSKSIKFVYNYFVPDEGDNDTGVSAYDKAFFSGGSISGGSYFVDSDGNKFMTTPDGSTSSASDILMRSPRQVELTWTPPVTFEDLPYQDSFEPLFTIGEAMTQGILTADEDIRSPIDSSIQYFDPRIDRRLQAKANLFLKLCNSDAYSFNSFEILAATSGLPDELYSGVLNQDDKIESDIQKLFVLNEEEGTKRINEISTEDPIPAFMSARSALIETYVDRRMIKDMADSSVCRYPYNRSKLIKYYDDDSGQRENLPKEADPPLENVTSTIEKQKDINIETPALASWALESSEESLENTNNTNYSMLKLVGYIVNRYDNTIQDLGSPSKTFIVDSALLGAPNIIDTEILYGGEYYYSVRTVYCREFLDIDATDLRPKRMQQWIASKPSEPLYVNCVETTPPHEPDGLFYRFNYGVGKGIMLSWQYPSDRKRDTKYFQIFRRSSITEPFTCIAEIDFNDAHVRYPRREHVDEARVISYSSVQTFYEDTEFTRDSNYIYAIAAVDAHGLTSGYSHQTRVSFNRDRNELVLTGISRSGAPKQYPNFFVDPDMDETTFSRTFTQDCIRSSGKKRLTIFFGPDVETFTRSNSYQAQGADDDPVATEEVKETNLVTTTGGENGEGIYKLHLINLDRQKDDSIEIRIDDFRGVELFAQE